MLVYASIQVFKYASVQMQVCKYENMHTYAIMQVWKYAHMQEYTCLYKKLNKKKEMIRPYPRLQDFFNPIWTMELI